MSYQEAGFGDIHHESSQSSRPGYSASHTAPFQSSEQQSSASPTTTRPSANQRLLFAILSLFLLLLGLTMAVITVAITSPGFLLPILVICLTFFFTGFLFVNIQFNRNKF